ncbi:MAG: ThiF family adenylyltransferase [Chitinophagaceae bacterium]|jgi:molybdopterin/thiamine biosynthesis adenylyltransferase|nr:ThiF family adenylyltransferase [Chitinophagaceae bacterium]
MNTKKNSNYYGRFKSAVWFDSIQSSVISIYGQGGIGSYLTFFLARTGAHLITYDFDIVEDHNIAGQLYGVEDIGKPKVQAMKDVINRLCGTTEITTNNTKVDENCGLSSITFSNIVCTTFDSIYMRRLVFDEWCCKGLKGSVFVDGRMSMEQGNVFLVEFGNEQQIKDYIDNCFDDKDIKEPLCTMKATSHCAALIATLMVSHITNWLANNTNQIIRRAVSSKTDINLPLLTFTTKEYWNE